MNKEQIAIGKNLLDSIKELEDVITNIKSAIDNPDDLTGMITFYRNHGRDLYLNTEEKALSDTTRQRLEELTTTVLHMYLVMYKNELQKLQKEFDAL